MFDKTDRNEISLNLAAQDWLKSDKSAINRWWWFWNRAPISHAVLVVLFLPVCCALLWHASAGSAGGHGANLYILAPFVWLSTLYVAHLIFKEHMRHALSLKFTDSGIELKNRIVSRSILWSSIKRVLPTNNGEFVVGTADGAYYFPADQDWSEAAAERIRKAASISSESHSVIMSLDPKFKMTVLLITIPVVFALIAQFLKPFIYGDPATPGYLLAVLLFAAPVMLVFGACYYVQMYTVPEIFLAGEKILVVDRNGEHQINLSDITRVWMIGAVCWISTKNGSWSVPMGSVVDPSLPKIPFSKNKMKTQQASVKKAKQQMLELKPKCLDWKG